MLFNKIISKKISSWINVLKKTPWKVVLANIIKKKRTMILVKEIKF
jgi:hypothetical protein